MLFDRTRQSYPSGEDRQTTDIDGCQDGLLHENVARRQPSAPAATSRSASGGPPEPPLTGD
jgi:hypothetical protein